MPSRLAIITFISGPGGEIDNSLPGGFPGSPDNSLPWFPGRPDNSLPRPPVRPDNGLPVGPPGSIGTLPVFPFDPTERPDNSLPGGGGNVPTNPIVVHPGLKLVVRYVACHGFIAVPDNELPGGGGAQPKKA